MGLMFRRRRPVMRMAVGGAVAATAYHAGKGAGSQQGAAEEPAQQPQYAPPPPAPAPAPAETSTDELERLASLHSSGALTDEEFAAAKAKALGI